MSFLSLERTVARTAETGTPGTAVGAVCGSSFRIKSRGPLQAVHTNWRCPGCGGLMIFDADEDQGPFFSCPDCGYCHPPFVDESENTNKKSGSSTDWAGWLGIAAAFVYAGGHVLQGLVNRRNAEKALFLKPDESP